MNVESEYFPEIVSIGKLDLVEEYLYFNRPILAAWQNRTGQLYLALIVDETEDDETWFFLPVSQGRLSHIRTGHIDLNTAFRDSEDGTIYVVVFPNEVTNVLDSKRVLAESIDNEYFPVEGTTLDLDTETLAPLADSLIRKADQAYRMYFRVRLVFDDMIRTEAPARRFGQVLESLQDTLDAIAQSLEGKATARGQIPTGFKQQAQMNVVAIGAGSFEAELASNERTNLFGNSLVGDAVSEFQGLITTGADFDTLKEQLNNLESRVASKYGYFLKVIGDDIEHVYFESAAPKTVDVKTSDMSSENAKIIAAAIGVMDVEPPETLRVLGELVIVDLLSRRFGVRPLKPEGHPAKIDGKVSDNAFESISTATMGEKYVFDIEKTTSHKVATGETEVYYELLSMSPSVTL